MKALGNHKQETQAEEEGGKVRTIAMSQNFLNKMQGTSKLASTIKKKLL
jgi:hypothetical protein